MLCRASRQYLSVPHCQCLLLVCATLSMLDCSSVASATLSLPASSSVIQCYPVYACVLQAYSVGHCHCLHLAVLFCASWSLHSRCSGIQYHYATACLKQCYLVPLCSCLFATHSSFSTAVSLGEMCPFGPVQLK